MNTLRSLVRPAAVLAAVAAACALAACSRGGEERADAGNDDRTVGQQVDSAIASVGRSADQAQQDAKTAMGDIRQESREVAREMGAKVADAAITASVNADLAKDPELSALRIDVDTTDGKVTLHGTAPNAGAKDRAAKLASNVKGVNSVDNQLAVR